MLNFEELHRRLVESLRQCVRNGTTTERRLARVTGISQPHMHHVLNGKRAFSMATADLVLRTLSSDLLDLLEPAEIAEWQSRE